jgi:hypothetical protein
VSAAGAGGGKKLCERAIPAAFRIAGRCRGDHLPRLLVLAASHHDGRMRASFGEDLAGTVRTRSDVPLMHVSGVDRALCPLSMENRPMNPASQERETSIRADTMLLAVSTRD